MKMNQYGRSIGILAVSILLLCASAMAETDVPTTPTLFKPQASFMTDKLLMTSQGPFSSPGKHAVPKGKMTFLVVCIGDATPETPVSTNDLALIVQDGSGATYSPIGFGCPMQGSDEKITFFGLLKNGDFKIEGAKKSTVGIVFTVPKESKNLSLVSEGKKTPLSISDKYQPAPDARVSSLLFSGRLSSPPGGDTWEVK